MVLFGVEILKRGSYVATDSSVAPSYLCMEYLLHYSWLSKVWLGPFVANRKSLAHDQNGLEKHVRPTHDGKTGTHIALQDNTRSRSRLNVKGNRFGEPMHSFSRKQVGKL